MSLVKMERRRLHVRGEIEKLTAELATLDEAISNHDEASGREVHKDPAEHDHAKRDEDRQHDHGRRRHGWRGDRDVDLAGAADTVDAGAGDDAG